MASLTRCVPKVLCIFIDTQHIGNTLRKRQSQVEFYGSFSSFENLKVEVSESLSQG